MPVRFERTLFRRFLVGTGWLTCYPAGKAADSLEDAVREDWAESLAFYLHDLREGSLYVADGRTVCFRDLAPARARLIREWLTPRAPCRRWGIARQDDHCCLDLGYRRLRRAREDERYGGRWMVWNRATMTLTGYGRQA